MTFKLVNKFDNECLVSPGIIHTGVSVKKNKETYKIQLKAAGLN